MQRWDGPYKVLWHDKTRSLYQFDVGKEQFHNSLHVSRIKLYVGEPTNPQRRPCLSPSVEADNLEIKRIIGHRFRQQGGLQFRIMQLRTPHIPMLMLLCILWPVRSLQGIFGLLDSTGHQRLD